MAEKTARRTTIHFGTKLFLVALRIVIGWHFFYEGVYKLTGDVPFSSEGYLRASVGPFGDFFRGMIPDADGLEALQKDAALNRLESRSHQIANHYELNDEQRKQFGEKSEQVRKDIEAIFAGADFQLRLDDYKKFLQRVQAHPAQNRPDFEAERREADMAELDRIRVALLKTVNGSIDRLERIAQTEIITPDQLANGGTPPARRPTWLLDVGMAWGLTIVGLLLMLGLFTRISSLVACGLLAMFYLSFPPLPGVPPAPNAEGHYLIVNKNLIELIALLALATTRSGWWWGLDSWFSRFVSGRGAAPVPQADEHEDETVPGQPATSPTG